MGALDPALEHRRASPVGVEEEAKLEEALLSTLHGLFEPSSLASSSGARPGPR